MGDFHSTVETIRQEQHGLMGVDRSLPITPLPVPGTNNINPFDTLVNQRNAQQATPLPSTLIKSNNFIRPDERRSRPHPLNDTESGNESVKHSKKRKKEKRQESPRNTTTEHAQSDFPPKSFSFPPKPTTLLHEGEEAKQRSNVMTSSGSHVMPEVSAHHKPNRLIIDTSSLDSTDLQSIKVGVV